MTKQPYARQGYVPGGPDGLTMGRPDMVPKVFNGKDTLFFMAKYEAFVKRGNKTGSISLALPRCQGLVRLSAIRGINIRSDDDTSSQLDGNHYGAALSGKHPSRGPH